MYEKVVNTIPEVNKPLSAKYAKSFAYPTFKERAPRILDGIVACLNKNEKELAAKIGQEALDELEGIIDEIRELGIQMKTDQPLTEISPINGVIDEELIVYNSILKEKREQGQVPTWFETEWLFAECYMYRRLNQIFKNSKWMQSFDPFLGVKIDTLLGSKSPIVTVAQVLHTLKTETVNLAEEKRKEMFMYFVRCALWGNQADLSLSGGKAVTAEDHSHTINESSILVNDAEQMYKCLSSADPEQCKVVRIILDNAGFELYNDLCLADFLVWSGLAQSVVFHGKSIPWFVSDVTQQDFDLIFKLLKEEIHCQEIHLLVDHWLKYMDAGTWSFKCEPFWVLPYDYSQMETVDPNLYQELSKSRLLVFKGDLNYRKLMGDIYWDPTTTFEKALRGFKPANLIALRTVKADTISGLQPGVAEATAKVDPDWMITGKYALIQMFVKYK